MNLSQIMRKARFEVDAIRASGVNSALWSDEEVIDAVNTAMDRAARLIRLADSNLLTKAMKSTDSSVDFVSEVYSPTNLAMVSSQIDYTMPPDFVSIHSIVPTTDGYGGVKFYPASLNQKGWIDQSVLTAADLSTIAGSEQIFYYLVLGPRTLRIRPIMTENFDVEVMYRYRPARLQNYSAGSVSLTSGSTGLHGKGTAWLTAGVRDPADLITTSTTAVTINAVYPRISSVTSDSEAVLSKAWPSEPLSSSSYHISMIPRLPEEHHSWLAQLTAAIMLKKVSPELSKTSQEDIEKQLNLEVQPEIVIRQAQESVPVDEYTLP